MHIGICLNCRYIDLIENLGTAADSGVFCPRCGTEMSSLGVRSDEWNALTAKQKEKLVRERFPTHEDLFGPRVSPIILEMPEEEKKDVNITGQQPTDDTVEIMERYSEDELAEVSMYGPEDAQDIEEPEETKEAEIIMETNEPDQSDNDAPPEEEIKSETEPPETEPRDEYDIEQV